MPGSLAFSAENRIKTPELSARPPETLVVGLKDSQSTFSTKLRKTWRVYHSRPNPFGLASRIDPKMVRKSPPPAICHPWRDPMNNGLNARSEAVVRLLTIASAVRRASVVAVSDGFAEP